jgi:hypothetical protein
MSDHIPQKLGALSARAIALLLIIVFSSTAWAMDEVRISPDQRGFVLSPSGKTFVPWGHNYGHPDALIEDFWIDHWDQVEADFAEMRRMGSTTVRVHLQFGKFMDGPDHTNAAALARLDSLLQLAEKCGLHLDLTGLGCYRKPDVPAWYDAMDESQRWAAQAAFWQAIAAHGAKSPAVFCYDLINEPVVPGGQRNPGAWLVDKDFGGFYFIQWISLDQKNRPRSKIAADWIDLMTAAIRQEDRGHLITVGMLPPLKQGGYIWGFLPDEVARHVDFLSIHIYPETGKVADSIDVLKQITARKPIVIEETFPLSCGAEDLRQFLIESKPVAAGWIGHYAGESREKLTTLREQKKITTPQAIMLSWEDLFIELTPQMSSP